MDPARGLAQQTLDRRKEGDDFSDQPIVYMFCTRHRYGIVYIENNGNISIEVINSDLGLTVLSLDTKHTLLFTDVQWQLYMN